MADNDIFDLENDADYAAFIEQKKREYIEKKRTEDAEKRSAELRGAAKKWYAEHRGDVTAGLACLRGEDGTYTPSLMLTAAELKKLAPENATVPAIVAASDTLLAYALMAGDFSAFVETLDIPKGFEITVSLMGASGEIETRVRLPKSGENKERKPRVAGGPRAARGTAVTPVAKADFWASDDSKVFVGGAEIARGKGLKGVADALGIDVWREGHTAPQANTAIARAIANGTITVVKDGSTVKIEAVTVETETPAETPA